MRILLLAPYCGGSHQAWAQGYAAHSAHAVTLLPLPARFWKWRMQGGAVTLAEMARALPDKPDRILATDMVNLPAFLGLTRDIYGGVPVALYCHENQLTYPLRAGEKRDLTYAMINWLSMLAADRVFFNSEFHLQDWFEEAPRLLKHLPDFTHVHRLGEVRAKAKVLPVGCGLAELAPDTSLNSRSPDGPPAILWNQRWEYDKDPQTFLRALHRLAADGVDFSVILAGKGIRHGADETTQPGKRLGDRVIHRGFASRREYVGLLRRADVVVSTAIHEFFGVSVVEAVYSGCFPVLPKRLAHPELIPAEFHDLCLYDDFEGLMAKLRWALEHVLDARGAALRLRPAMVHYDWHAMAPRYDAELAAIAQRRSNSG